MTTSQGQSSRCSSGSRWQSWWRKLRSRSRSTASQSKSSNSKAPGHALPELDRFTRLHIWYGKKRLEKGIDNFASANAYCDRLLQVYDQMRPAPEANPGRPSALLSHVPEWTRSLSKDPEASSPRFSIETIRAVPRLQAALANCTSYTPSKWLLEQEMARRVASENPAAMSAPADIPKTGAGSQTTQNLSWSEGDSKDVYEAAADQRLSGLCLSGGGIRSATFGLGILQALAAADRLRSFDYISSVSGGGYIHQWLVAWILREPLGLSSVRQKLIPQGCAGAMVRAPEQINWLRRYSSYLTPQRGMLSADTWTMVATWFRNTFLNQIVLMSFLAVVLLLIRALMRPFTAAHFSATARLLGSADIRQIQNLGEDRMWQWLLSAAAVCATVWALIGAYKCGRALNSLTDEPRPGAMPPAGAMDNFAVLEFLVIPGFMLSALAALSAVGVFHPRTLQLPNYLRTLSHFLVRTHGLHLMVLLWLFCIAALVTAVSWGGHVVATAISLQSGNKWAKWVGFLACGFASVLLAVALALIAVTPVFHKENLAQISVRIAHDLDRVLDKSAPATSPPKSGSTHAPLPSRANTVCPIAHVPETATIAVTSTTCMIATDPAAEEQPTSDSERHIPPGALIALFLPLAFFATQFTAIRIDLGLIGRSYEESRREWLARYGGWAAMVSLLWFVLGFIAVIGPSLYYWIFVGTLKRKSLSALIVLAIHAITLYSGYSSKNSGAPDPRKFLGYSVLDLIGIVGAPIAILSLLIVTSGWLDLLIQQWVLHVRFNHTTLDFILLGAATLCILLLFGWRVDVNEFSMHPFYRDRLARCYIGASNGCRVPDPFIGFDDHTEVSYNSISMAELLPVRFQGNAPRTLAPRPKQSKSTPQPAVPTLHPYDGPMPIFCSTVNLTFSKDLAYQDRKGASFAFTPLYSGYHTTLTDEQQSGKATTYNGFVPTPQYAYRKSSDARTPQATSGIALTTAAAISGAALSPNQGYSSQPPLAFLMTLFNVRLGWWIANPRRPWIWPSTLNQPTPRFGLRYLLSELVGHSSDTSNYVSLSDGGKFDNMGLYELVRRRCSCIIICDGEEDKDTTFEGLGLAVAKARIDFGVEILFPPEEVKRLAPSKRTGCSSIHFMKGTIRYPPPPGCREHAKYTGEILYLKTAFVGDEPIDLVHYKREHPDFPQESTVNQWFTETQFESYRRLGQFTAEIALSSTTSTASTTAGSC